MSEVSREQVEAAERMLMRAGLPDYPQAFAEDVARELAAMLAEARAEAWGEGWESNVRGGAQSAINPYLADTLPRGHSCSCHVTGPRCPLCSAMDCRYAPSAAAAAVPDKGHDMPTAVREGGTERRTAPGGSAE
jgi:hypothetical protein